MTTLAFVNFDRFIDSKRTADKETLHDIVGVISQICYPQDDDYVENEYRHIDY